MAEPRKPTNDHARGRARPRARVSRALAVMLASGLVWSLSCPSAAFGQTSNPVYVDDAPRAREALGRVPGLLEAGNAAEAVRAVQQALEDSGDRLIASGSDASLFIPVRQAAHALLLGDAALLARYRQAEGPGAAARLAAGEIHSVERDSLLTEAGFEACLRLAQAALERGSFDSAWLMLTQLERHPDRTPRSARSAQAAELMALLARYLDDDDARATAIRWWRQSGREGEPALEPVPPPPGARTPAVHPLTSNDRIELGSIQTTPMASTPTSPVGTDPIFDGRNERERQAMRDAASWVFPTVVGDVVFVNDGRTISAWDRFTLEPIWRAEPVALTEQDLRDERRLGNLRNFRPGSAQPPADSNTITVAGPIAIAATGISYNEGRDGDPRLHAVDARTGRVLWSRPLASASEELGFAVPRGGVMIDGETAIVAARKFVQARRVLSSYLVGLDVWTGETRWVRLLASTGSMPFRMATRPTPVPTLDRGVIYHADESGVIASVEAETGRVRWVRRFSAETSPRGVSTPPFVIGTPVVHAGRVYALTPMFDLLVALDAQTGDLLGSRRAFELGEPEYLVRVGDHLAGVSPDRVSFVPLSDPLDAQVRLSGGLLAGRTPAGRAVASGDRLLLPMSDGLLVFDAHSPRTPGFVATAHAGNAVATGGQLLIAGANTLHSHPVWSVASAELEARLDRDPSDPRPAVTLAQLAFRSGVAERIVPAADRALRAIEADPLSPVNSASRARLHETLLGVLHADAETVGGRAVGDVALLSAIVDRLGRTADSAEERVAHLFALARLREGEGRVDQAIAAYQSVLREPALRAAMWRGSRIRARGDHEASRRVRDLVRAHGTRIYATHDAEAEMEASAMLGSGAPRASALEDLARRYPAASSAWRWWLMAASAYERSGRHGHADAARAHALESATLNAALHRPGAGAAMAETALVRLEALARERRESEAAELLLALERDYPQLDLAGGSALLARIRREGSAGLRLATVGAEAVAVAQRLHGWRLRTPLTGGRFGQATSRLVMHSAEERSVGVFASSPGGGLELLWSVEHAEDAEPVLVRHDDDGLVLFHPHADGGGSFERLDGMSGRRVWVTARFADLFERDEGFESRFLSQGGQARLVDTPLTGIGTLRDVLIADTPGSSLIAAERSGRVASIDLRSGRVQWAVRTPVERVYDIDASGPVVALIGETLGDASGRHGLQPRLVTMEAGSGRVLRRDDASTPSPRWVRVSPDGRVYVGAESGVLSMGTDGVHWAQAHADATETFGAWVVGPSLILRDQHQQLRRMDRETGRLERDPIPAGRRLDVRDGLRVLIEGDTLEVMTPRGVLAVDGAGALLGIDALETFDHMTTPAPTRSYYFAIDRRGLDRGDGRREHALYVFRRPDGRLAADPATVILDRRPSELAVIDGRVAITAGNDTVILSAPAPARPAANNGPARGQP